MKLIIQSIKITHYGLLLTMTLLIAALPFHLSFSLSQLLWGIPASYLFVFCLHAYLDFKIAFWQAKVKHINQNKRYKCAWRICPNT